MGKLKITDKRRGGNLHLAIPGECHDELPNWCHRMGDQTLETKDADCEDCLKKAAGYGRAALARAFVLDYFTEPK